MITLSIIFQFVETSLSRPSANGPERLDAIILLLQLHHLLRIVLPYVLDLYVIKKLVLVVGTLHIAHLQVLEADPLDLLVQLVGELRVHVTNVGLAVDGAALGLRVGEGQPALCSLIVRFLFVGLLVGPA